MPAKIADEAARQADALARMTDDLLFTLVASRLLDKAETEASTQAEPFEDSAQALWY